MQRAKQVSGKLIPGEYIVVFKEQWGGRINNEVAQEALQFINDKISKFEIDEKHIKSRYEHALRGFAATLTEAQLETIKKNPFVDFIEQNRKVNFMLSSSFNKVNITRSSLNLMSQTTPWGVSRVGGPLDGIGKKAWILDTGIDLDHPDLNVDIINSVSFVAMESANDADGHGTHVAGIIAAKNNSIGVVGVAAGATVVAVKVLALDPDDTEVSDVVDGVNYVTGKASSNDIVNMSLGAYDPYNSIRSVDLAVNNAANNGIRFTIAAGNNGLDANDFTPARVNNSNVWTVSAFRQGDEFVQVFDWNTPNCNSRQNPYKGSNYGNPPVDFSGPGESILSLWKNGGTLTTCGTSMAAPHIAGILLATGQEPYINKYVSNDPDNNPDPIASSKPYVQTPLIVGSVVNDHPKLTWNTCEGATEYQVWRKADNSGPWTLWSTTSSTSYNDYVTIDPTLTLLSGLPNGPDGWIAYKVIAIHEDGFESSDSQTLYFTYDGIVPLIIQDSTGL